MPKRTIDQGSLQNVTEDGKVVGFKLGVRLSRYRGNMLSLINGYYLKVDGEVYPQSAMKFEINGKAPRTFEEIKTAVWEHWNYQDTAYLYVEKEGGLAPGEHEIVAVASNFEQYGYNSQTDQKRVDEVIEPEPVARQSAIESVPQILTLTE